MKPDVVTVAVSRADGGVTVLRVVENEYTLDGSLSRHYDVTREYVDELIVKYGWTGPLAPVGWEFVPNDYVGEHTDRAFRDAWKHAPGHPIVDMPKAREVHRTRLRRMRAPLLEQLDTEYMRADERGDAGEKQRIAHRKQALRDAPADPRIDAAQTPEDLKAVIPAALAS